MYPLLSGMGAALAVGEPLLSGMGAALYIAVWEPLNKNYMHMYVYMHNMYMYM